MGKILDLVPRLKTVSQDSMASKQLVTDVVDFTEQKEKMLFFERRQVKRTILTEFISAMVVLPEKGLLKVGLFDISDEGVSFDLDLESGNFKVGEELAMRVYLNHITYFPIQVVIKHTTVDLDEGVTRHGTEFLKGAPVDVALQHFVKFIESVSSGLKKDSGDLMVTRTS